KHGLCKRGHYVMERATSKKRTIEIWNEIADQYKNERMILGYDLIREPAIDKKREKELIDLHKDISSAMRAHDRNHMIVYEGNNYAIDLAVLSKFDEELDKNGCYSFHLYTWLGLKIKNHLPKFMWKAFKS
ncbi:MAG: cellulase family glycosylhydrolase, partial [Flavobacteriales bacterium]